MGAAGEGTETRRGVCNLPLSQLPLLLHVLVLGLDLDLLSLKASPAEAGAAAGETPSPAWSGVSMEKLVAGGLGWALGLEEWWW